MDFDHVGVIVRDLAVAKAFAEQVLGLGPPVAEADVPEHGLKAAFYALGGADRKLEVFTFDHDPMGRLPDGAPAAMDHVAVLVADLEATRAELAADGVTFTGPVLPDLVEEPVLMRGRRHLWTTPSTSGGYRIQLTEI